MLLKGLGVIFWGLGIDSKKERTNNDLLATSSFRNQGEEDGPARNWKGIACEIEGYAEKPTKKMFQGKCDHPCHMQLRG